MVEKELKRMSRRELLELLIAQMEENETLKQDLASAQTALQDKRIVIENAGSLAEAAMQLNGVFDAAQDAARQYLENLRMMDEQREQISQSMQTEAQERAAAILAEAEEYSRNAHEEADAYWRQMHDKADRLLREQNTAQELP